MSKVIFEASGKVQELNEQLEALHQQDKTIEAKRKKAGIGCACVFAALVLSGVGVAATEGNPVLIGLTVVLAVAFITMIVIYARFSSQDFDDRKVDTAMKLFGVVGKDIPPKAKCSVMVSFLPYDKHGTLVSKDGGMFSTIVQKVYEDEWFVAKGSLYDGNKFQIAVKQTIKRKEKRKRKRTKVNEKHTENLALTLILDASSYPGFAGASERVDASAQIAGMQIKSVTQTDNKLKVVATATCTMAQLDERLVNGDRLLALFMHVYSALAPCRAQSA